MVENPDQEQRRELESSPKGRKFWLGVGTVLTVAVGGGLAYGWIFIHRQLAPLVSKQVSTLVNRPVNLGEVERFSLKGIHFGESGLPSTATETDYASVEAIQVAFNPLTLITNRTLSLDITLINPKAYIEQDPSGVWVNTDLTQGEKGAVEIKVGSINLKNAEVTILPRLDGEPLKPIDVNLKNAQVNLLNDYQLIQLDSKGTLSEGKFNLSGEIRPETIDTDLKVEIRKLDAAEFVATLLDGQLRGSALPVNLETGEVTAKLDIAIRNAQLSTLDGEVSIDDFSTKFIDLPQISPAKSDGKVTLQGREITIERFTTLIDDLEIDTIGTVHIDDGFNITAKTQPATVDKLLKITKIKQPLPVAVTGEVEAAVQVGGSLQLPEISAFANTTRPTTIDKVNFSTIKAAARLVENNQKILASVQAVPAVGGQVAAQGNILLGKENKNNNLAFNLAAADLPTTKLASLYGAKLPGGVGNIYAQGKVSGSLDKLPQINGSGNAQFDFAGGSITAQQFQLNGDNWRGKIVAQGIQVSRIQELPEKIRQPGEIRAEINTSGNLKSLALDGINADGIAMVNNLAGGQVVVDNIKVSQGNWQGNILTSGIQLGQLAALPIPLQGSVDSVFQASGNLNKLNLSGVNGKGVAALTLPGGEKVTLTNLQLANNLWEVDGQTQVLPLAKLSTLIPAELDTAFTGKFSLNGSLTNLNPSAVNGLARGNLALAGGNVNTNARVRNGQWQANIRAQDIEASRFSPLLPAPVRDYASQLGDAGGNFRVSGNLDNLTPQGINLQGNGNLALAGGEITATNAKVQNGKWQANIRAKDIEASRFSPLLPTPVRDYASQLGDAGGNFRVSGNLDNLTPQGINLQGNGNLALGEGEIRATDVQLSQGEFQAVINPSNIALNPFVEQLQGNLDGTVNVKGNLANLNPGAIAADGRIRLSEGIPSLGESLTAKFAWQEGRLNLPQVQSPNLDLNGYVDVNLAQSGLGIIEDFDLDIDIQEVDLAQLPLNLPDIARDIEIAGIAGFDGKVAGKITSPDIQGNLALSNLLVDIPGETQLNFDSEITGEVEATPGKGASLNLQGDEDYLKIALDKDYLPTNLSLQLAQFNAQGERKGNRFNLATTNLPLAPLKKIALIALENIPNNLDLPPQLLAQPLDGNLSSDVTVNLGKFSNLSDLSNLDNLDVEAEVAVENPQFGYLEGDKLDVDVEISQGSAFIPQISFQQGESKYSLLDTQIKPTTGIPELTTKVKVEQGDIEQILKTARIYTIEDLRRYSNPNQTYGNASDLGTNPVGDKNAPILNQINRLVAIQANQENQQNQQPSTIPRLDELTGKFNFDAEVAASPDAGIVAKGIDFQSLNPWRWGKYDAKQINVKGDFADGIITLKPVRLELEDNSFISFAGNVGGNSQSGQLKLRNIPVTLIDRIVKLPPTIALDGNINATAALAGSQDNPQTKGSINIVGGKINGKEIESARGSFSYNNARLEFSGRSFLEKDSDPVTIEASFPYQLPFATVAPQSNQLALDIDIKDKGFILVDLLTRGQVSWEEGKGEIQLDIIGEFNQEEVTLEGLVAKGIITLEDGVVATQYLPDTPITDLQGKISFNFDRIDVEEIEGKLSEGKVTIAGNLPIFQGQTSENSLIVNLDQLKIDNFLNLYSGGVDGKVEILGTALEPEISGNVDLYHGQVSLPTPGGTATSAGVATVSESQDYISFNDFNISLDKEKSVEVTIPFLLNIISYGDLAINGALSDLRPQGIINLRSGQVNLFTNQLALDRDYENRAIFDANQGITDPSLDLQLTTTVTEVNRQPGVAESLSPEVSITSAGLSSSQQVIIRARVSGSAQKLAEINENSTGIVDLSSVPSRSETEILSLLGGSLINNFADDATVGIANIASSALFSNLENSLRENLGLSEFRVFPTRVSDGNSGGSDLTVGLEAGLDITNSLSVSVLKIFAEDRPAQYSLRYRLDEGTYLRSTTDLAGNNGVAVQYELRF